MGKAGWTGCVRNHKGKLSNIGGKEVVSAVRSSIKSIRESEWVQSKPGQRRVPSLPLYVCVCVSVYGVSVFVYPDIICSSMEIGFTYLVNDLVLVYLET